MNCSINWRKKSLLRALLEIRDVSDFKHYLAKFLENITVIQEHQTYFNRECANRCHSTAID